MASVHSHGETGGEIWLEIGSCHQPLLPLPSYPTETGRNVDSDQNLLRRQTMVSQPNSGNIVVSANENGGMVVSPSI